MRRQRSQKPDTGNAHVRQPSSKRQSPNVQADEAQRLLDDPAFIRGFQAVHDSMVSAIISLKHDGSQKSKDYEAECCRILRTAHATKRLLIRGVQGQQLRLAEYQSTNDGQTGK